MMFLNKIFDLLKIFILGLLDRFYIAGSSQCSLETHVNSYVQKFTSFFAISIKIPSAHDSFENFLKRTDDFFKYKTTNE